MIEVYTQGMMPLALSEGEYEISVPVEDGATYVLYVAGQASPAEFVTTLHLEVPDPTAPPAARPRYYTNIANALDTNADGDVSPLDALVVINSLNRHSPVSAGAGLLFLDVTGDEDLSPLDALRVINYLNAGGSGSGEGESGGASAVESAGNTSESLTASTKFFVVDSVADRTFGYGAGGAATQSFDLAGGVSEPTGITSNRAGDTLWVVDRLTHQVTVQESQGALRGSWTAAGLSDPQGIATDETHIWIVDAAQDRVFRYSEAAVRTSGTAFASNSFDLDRENDSPSDITTDGSAIWVTDDQTDEVFVYDAVGTLLGRWRLDPSNADPSGITNNPAGGSDLWIVDRADRLVYHYANSTPLRTGSRAASDSFPLAVGNQHPEGIADPPTPDPPILTVSNPVGETTLPAGQTMVLSGQARDGSGAAALVRVNGQPIQVSDDAGNFFQQVQIAPGTNTFQIEASDAAGDTTTTTVKVDGTQLPVGTIDFARLSVVSSSTLGLYGRTSWHDANNVLYADFGVENIGRYTVDGPVLVGVTNISDPSVRLRDARGTTPEGIPYFDMSSLVADGSLPPGESSSLQTIGFFVPGRAQFTYDLVFFATLNQAPRMATVPDVEAISGHLYVYDVGGFDADGDELTFSLVAAPAGMAVTSDYGAR